MKKNRMGNLLSIAGDDAEDIKQFIDSFLSQDSESDDPEEKCVDFAVMTKRATKTPNL